MPVKVGVVTLVMRSVDDTPLSEAAVRTGADGAAALVSIVTASAGDSGLTTPETVSVAAIWYVPAASFELVIVQVPAVLATAVPSTVVPLA